MFSMISLWHALSLDHPQHKGMQMAILLPQEVSVLWQGCLHEQRQLGQICSLMHMQISMKSHILMTFHQGLEHLKGNTACLQMIFLMRGQFLLQCHYFLSLIIFGVSAQTSFGMGPSLNSLHALLLRNHVCKSLNNLLSTAVQP